MRDPSDALMKLCGWKKIASQNHANNLFRRELKLLRKFNISRGKVYDEELKKLFDIVPGTWYKYTKRQMKLKSYKFLIVRKNNEK
jgi:hypothetical protein